jgi:hypothetical protein
VFILSFVYTIVGFIKGRNYTQLRWIKIVKYIYDLCSGSE